MSESGMGASTDEHWIAIAMAPPMTEREKALRDLFVSEYMEDYNPIAAAMRCGFSVAYAQDYATRFINEPYVQQRIKEITHMQVDPVQSEEYNKQRVMQVLLKEAHNPGTTGAARVQAASKLAAIMGMDKPIKIDQTVTNRGGVLMVPAVANLADWERIATESQQALTANARD